jgi:rhomboid protease GluP
MSSQDEETRELIARMNREFGQRPQPGDTPPPSEGQVYNLGTPPPQPMRLSLPLNRPRAVYVLLAINVVMYGLTQLVALRLQGTPNPFSLALLALGAKWGPAIQAGEYWRFLTPIVLHGNLLHLAFNSYALFSLGPEAERIFGTRRFLVIYLIAGFAGTLASFILSPGLSIGASASRQQVTQLITMAGINLFLGLTVPTIDNAAHIGGLIAGGAAGYVLSPSYAIDDRLYPPVVVRTDRAASTWLTVGGIVVVLVVLAAWAVGRR